MASHEGKYMLCSKCKSITVATKLTDKATINFKMTQIVMNMPHE